MASSNRSSNGRSPLVRKQSQITAFFSLGKSPPIDVGATSSPDPTPPPASHKKKPPLFVGSTPPSARSKEPGVSRGEAVAGAGVGSPSMSSPGSQRKPPLVIGVTPPVPASKELKTPGSGVAEKKGLLYSSEVVGRRIKVYWPLDKCWYEGYVRSFDTDSGTHVVQYDDGEEELLDLMKERTEWLVDEETPRSFRRLRRRISVSSEADVNDAGQDSPGGDSTEDEDWGKKMDKEVEDDDSEEVELEKENENGEKSSKITPESKKRENASVGKNSSSKKARICLPSVAAERSAPPSNMDEGPVHHACADNLASDATERFRNREMEKFQFLNKGRRDAKRRQPGDTDYDPKTLYLPQDFLKSLSGGQRQWWEFKARHMDKVLFFKMGKFYELFEMDAHVAAKELGLQYMKGDQPHCGFPEKNFSMNLEKLARKGYRVLVIEQTETPEQLEFRRKEMGSKDKVVKREICAIVTKGTLTEGELLSTNPDASYLLSLTENCTSKESTVIGVCVVDAATSKFMLGQFKDDLERHCLCSLLSELRPVEVIRPSKVLSQETDMILQKHTRSPLVNNLVPISEFWDADRTISEISGIFDLPRHKKETYSMNEGISCNLVNNGENEMHLPAVLSELIVAGESGKYAISAFGGCIFYLRQALLDETLLRCSKFEPLPYSDSLNNFKKSYMILDAAALDNLEILENNRDGGRSGTLFAQLDHCVTAFAKRLLKSWLVRPLYDADLIVERQDAIAGLKGSSLASALEFRKDLSRLPDMERLLARVFGSCEANGRNANRVVLYEDACKKLLKEFITALRGCQLMSQACLSLSAILDNTKSSRLHHLLTPGIGLPDMFSTLKHFREAFDWSEAENFGRIIPHEGGDAEYDSACKMVKDIEHNLTVYLKEQCKALGDSSTKYVAVGKDSYLLEVPEHLRSKVPQDYELHSSKKGYFRYWTPKIKKWLLKLSQAETERESKLKSIMQRSIEHFRIHHHKWRKLVSAIAELDVLISLAIAADFYEGPTCRPHIKAITSSDEATPSLYAKCLGHPLLCSDALGKGSFVPNDVNLGGANQPSFILLTGPNMGGKSTLLRQVCLAVILAQIGADVPAESFELSPVDRVFVRMGAKDHIMAGQSTFLTELSETASMLSSATCRSLVALDELGRGTSTSDGQAIAEAVLEYFICNVQCRGMFSTHYHRLAIAHAKNSKVSLCHMACQVGEGTEGAEEVTFLYRLTPGSCPKSYGVNVARLAGLPISVLQAASIKSNEFEAAYGKCRNALDSTLLSPRDGETSLFHDVLHLASGTDPNEKAVTLNLLVELQQTARLLMQES